MSTQPASLNTVDRAIRYAMEDAGLLPEGEVPTSEQYAKYLLRLQDLVNLYQTQGLKLWLLQDTAVTLVAGTSSYSIGVGGAVNMAKPWKVEEIYYLDTSGNRTPITQISWKEYLALSNVTNQGPINSVQVDKQVSQLVLKTWMVPDTTTAAGTLHVLLRTQATGYANLTDATMFPQEWFIALRWGLADDICGGQSQEIMQRCAMRALQFKNALEDWDVEDASVFFTVDTQRG